MKRALFLTAYDRPQYLAPVLDSWSDVRGLDRWRMVFRIEPSEVTDVMVRLVEQFIERTGLTDYEIIVNPQRYGVLHHPWVGFDDLFATCGFDFVVRAEDDLLVSTDILEYFEWASEFFAVDPRVAVIHGHTWYQGPDDTVMVTEHFSPLVWGTWRPVWDQTIRDTWDHDYSTFTGQPGHEAGWDWNLNKRILPTNGLKCAWPTASRVDHIGVVGTHGTPENFVRSESFQAQRPVTRYRLLA